MYRISWNPLAASFFTIAYARRRFKSEGFFHYISHGYEGSNKDNTEFRIIKQHCDRNSMWELLNDFLEKASNKQGSLSKKFQQLFRRPVVYVCTVRRSRNMLSALPLDCPVRKPWLRSCIRRTAPGGRSLSILWAGRPTSSHLGSRTGDSEPGCSGSGTVHRTP